MLPALWEHRRPGRSEDLPRIVQPGGDAVDGGAQSVIYPVCGGAGPLAAEEFDLHQAHGVNVRVAQADGAGQDWIPFELFFLPSDGEDHTASAFKFIDQSMPDAFTQVGVGDEFGVETCNG